MNRKRTRTPNRAARRRTADALKIIDRITGDDVKLRSMISQATINAQVAEMLVDARQKAGLTQAQLAAKVGTKQPVIARLEDAEYDGHSLTMLQRIAAALGRRLEVRFKPA